MSKEELNLKYLQMRFDLNIKAKKFDSAHRILKSVPPAKTPEAELKRLIFMAENYQRFTELFMEHCESRMKEYLSLGSINQLKVDNLQLASYKTLGTFTEVSSKINALDGLLKRK